MDRKQQREYARVLYLKENLTQAEIAERVGVSRATVNRWVAEGHWEDLKTGLTLTRDQQIGELYRQVKELNNAIVRRPEGERFPTPAEADTLGKLAAAIRKMENEAGLADIIAAGMKFLDWLRPQDTQRSKEYVGLWDAFIKDQIK